MKTVKLYPNTLSAATRDKVIRAIRHVRRDHPDVCMVVFGGDSRWQYMNEDFNAPKFGQSIDVGVLEDAQSAVDNEVGFPAVFQLA